jgi:hypothetical protein
MPLALTDEELDAVMNACRPLPVARREAFLQEIASALRRCNGEIGPGGLHRILVETQRRHFDPPNLDGVEDEERPRRLGRSKYR